jgi:tetratricopeptide (TPR) repeat protein
VKAGEGAEANAPISAEVAELYRRAIDAYQKVFEAKGAEMEVSPLRSIVNAYVQLQQYDEAIQLAEQVLQTHANEASLWNAYSTALQRAERIDEAVTALAKVKEIDPAFPDVAIRQANLLIQAGRFEDALPILQAAVQGGEDPNRAARMILGEATSKGVSANNYEYAIRLLEVARGFQVSAQQKEELDFFLGYSLLMSARAAQEPQTVQSAQATLPRFQRALTLLQGARAYDQRQGGRMNLGQLLEATNTYIEIQEAIIKRGR